MIDKDILQLDLAPIAYKVALDEAWDLADIDKTEKEYRAFLQVMRSYPEEMVVPTKSIDIFWHHHILDTQKYIRDCDDLFGDYMHHFPYSSTQDEEARAATQSQFAKTNERLQDLVKATWPQS